MGRLGGGTAPIGVPVVRNGVAGKSGGGPAPPQLPCSRGPRATRTALAASAQGRRVRAAGTSATSRGRFALPCTHWAGNRRGAPGDPGRTATGAVRGLARSTPELRLSLKRTRRGPGSTRGTARPASRVGTGRPAAAACAPRTRGSSAARRSGPASRARSAREVSASMRPKRTDETARFHAAQRPRPPGPAPPPRNTPSRKRPSSRLERARTASSAPIR